jgi:hypothetical protein
MATFKVAQNLTQNRFLENLGDYLYPFSVSRGQIQQFFPLIPWLRRNATDSALKKADFIVKFAVSFFFFYKFPTCGINLGKMNNYNSSYELQESRH